MKKELIIHGIPRSVARDGWWLNCSHERERPQYGSGGRNGLIWSGLRNMGPVFGLLLLILVADYLFWGYQTGLSLAVYCAVVFAIATLDVRPYRRLLRPAILLGFGMLPVVEQVQPLSLMFLGATLLGSLVWARHPWGGIGPIAFGTVRLALRTPVSSLSAIVASLDTFRHRSFGGATGAQSSPMRILLRNWAFPFGGTLVFGGLLLDANPVLANLFSFEPDWAMIVGRGFFWFGIGLLLWPMLDRSEPSQVPFRLPATNIRAASLGIDARSTLRALWMFNLLIGMQTFLDLSIFVGGADLPKGMTYASYAHRGAYPLLMTAILAGVFALVARPFLGEIRALKPLMMLWLVQNIALSLSALLRLDLYVDAFGLTYLRVSALIWIGLVALGLMLIVWQVWKSCTNSWLVIRGASLVVAILYLCSFINFAAIIADNNLARWPRTDMPYVCALGPNVAAVLEDNIRRKPELNIVFIKYRCPLGAPNFEGWRDWGFRKWRIIRYFDQIEGVGPSL